ncbi:hypothetical protein OMAG_002698 [Candidatus Omnitrophus magneticus]|uniref:Diadenylate cyclase n=1 Tax=Candidatus Omnitrophus magneticus TaxID=1609969 RepID=A0A0F0CJM2_9BACT|nr:hypothetical protein OMAG_002698 [Candidatus Omnitrophus magneticus]
MAGIIDFISLYWDTLLEIGILWVTYYMLFLILSGTMAEQVMKGIIIIVVIVAVTREINLVIINWILTKLLPLSVVAFFIIFQPELRRGLARLGRFGGNNGKKAAIGEISKATMVLSKKKVGGLIAIERKVGLRRYVESGVGIDAEVTSELINTIFVTSSPLHDGGIIISGDRIEAAACLFPLTQNTNIPKTVGTRHRAAIGLSEETDSIVIVVSEETGNISVAIGGRITRDLEPKNVSKFLEGILLPRHREKNISFNSPSFCLDNKEEL